MVQYTNITGVNVFPITGDLVDRRKKWTRVSLTPTITNMQIRCQKKFSPEFLQLPFGLLNPDRFEGRFGLTRKATERIAAAKVPKWTFKSIPEMQHFGLMNENVTPFFNGNILFEKKLYLLTRRLTTLKQRTLDTQYYRRFQSRVGKRYSAFEIFVMSRMTQMKNESFYILWLFTEQICFEEMCTPFNTSHWEFVCDSLLIM